MECPQNTVAGALSHCHRPTTVSAIDFNALAEAQVQDPDLTRLQSDRNMSSSTTWKTIHLPTIDSLVVCDTSTESPRPYVPAAFRRQVFDSLHGLAHPGIRLTRRPTTKRYICAVKYWTTKCSVLLASLMTLPSVNYWTIFARILQVLSLQCWWQHHRRQQLLHRLQQLAVDVRTMDKINLKKYHGWLKIS